MTNTYEKAYTEVLEILRFLPRDEYDKIPKEEIDFYESHRDKEYQYNYDPSKGLNEQAISREANAVLVSIFRDFFASEVQKEKLNQILTTNEQRQQAQLREQYNPNHIFQNKAKKAKTAELENNEKMVPYKESIFAKLFKKIRAIFQPN